MATWAAGCHRPGKSILNKLSCHSHSRLPTRSCMCPDGLCQLIVRPHESCYRQERPPLFQVRLWIKNERRMTSSLEDRRPIPTFSDCYMRESSGRFNRWVWSKQTLEESWVKKRASIHIGPNFSLVAELAKTPTPGPGSPAASRPPAARH